MNNSNTEKTVFERIYEQVRKIPKGKVATYGQIALYAGNARWARVVGYALAIFRANLSSPYLNIISASLFSSYVLTTV